MARDAKRHSQACKERYGWYKDRGICSTCGRVWAEPGHVRCKACEDNIAFYHNLRRAERTEAMRKRRAERIAAGICTECGKRKATEGMRMCPRCRAMRNDSTRKYKIEQRFKREADAARNRPSSINTGR